MSPFILQPFNVFAVARSSNGGRTGEDKKGKILEVANVASSTIRC